MPVEITHDNVVCDGAGRGREVPAGGPGLQHLEAALGCPGEMIAMMKGGVTTTFPRIPAVVQVRGRSQYPTEVAGVHPQITPPVISRRLAPRTVTASGARSPTDAPRSEEHTSELQSLMRISYAVFCLKKKKIKLNNMIK